MVLICSQNINMFEQIGKQLGDIGFSYCGIDEFVFSQQSDRILECINMLDENSAQIYYEVIKCRMFNKRIDSRFYDKRQYFSIDEFSIQSPKEVFVDCGAFVGDTIEQYVFQKMGTFSKIYAFEPDPRNFKSMQKRCERLKSEWALADSKIELVEGGVGSTCASMFVKIDNSSSGLGTRLENDSKGKEVKVYTLDSFFENKNITFLKADIESFEFDMLKGAETVICRDKPKIAVCIYHNASDMYQIQLYLASLNIGYKFGVRHHSAAFYDTVLYAWV